MNASADEDNFTLCEWKLLWQLLMIIQSQYKHSPNKEEKEGSENNDTEQRYCTIE